MIGIIDHPTTDKVSGGVACALPSFAALLDLGHSRDPEKRRWNYDGGLRLIARTHPSSSGERRRSATMPGRPRLLDRDCRARPPLRRAPALMKV
jgi:hypothetical protein